MFTWLLWIGLALPPLYFLVAVQYAAIVFPFWDHMATADLLIRYFDGTMTFHDLIEPMNQARPLFPRLIFIANAALTKWDLRSEYVYIYITLLGSGAALLAALLLQAGNKLKLTTIIAGMLISIVAFSPVAAVNHYYSLMLLATLSYALTIGAILIVSAMPSSVPANVVAAVLAWISAYSITEGLFVFPAIGLAHMVAARRLMPFGGMSLFWLINSLICCALYLPGVNVSAPAEHYLSEFLGFFFVYLGNPLGSLLWFPKDGSILLRHTTIINGLAGFGLLVVFLLSSWKVIARQDKSPAAFSLIAFGAYAILCDLVTAWGRATAGFALTNLAIEGGNSSRYAIFAACLLFGLILFYARKFADGSLRVALWHKVGLTAFVIAAGVSYVRAVSVYQIARANNDWLVNVYNQHGDSTPSDTRAYPLASETARMRSDMMRLGIGPYRAVAQLAVPISKVPLVGAIPLKPGATVVQPFKAGYPLLRGVTFRVVNWGKPLSRYDVRWSLAERKNGTRSIIEEGVFKTRGLQDWQLVTINFSKLSHPEQAELSLSVDQNVSAEYPVGVALYTPETIAIEPVIIDGVPEPNGGVMGLIISYNP